MGAVVEIPFRVFSGYLVCLLHRLILFIQNLADSQRVCQLFEIAEL